MAKGAESDIAQRIQRGENFLTNLFDASLQLLPEYKGSSVYWLFHDNYLAAHLLSNSRPISANGFVLRWQSLALPIPERSRSFLMKRKGRYPSEITF